MKFTTADEVEFIFELTLTAGQRTMVNTYIATGNRPAPGCDWCDEGFVRRLTGRMDAYDGPTPFPATR